MHPRLIRILVFASALFAAASALGAGLPVAPEPPDPGVVREEYLIPVTPLPAGHRTRGLPQRVPPPLEEVVVFEDSLNALTIDNEGNWTHVDNSERPPAWHLDTLYACQNKAWWCGRVDSSWVYDSNRRGYENSWVQYLSNSVWLDSLPGSGSVTIGFRHRFNAEKDYDYGAVQFYDWIDGFTSVGVFTGKVPTNQTQCDSVTLVIPDALIQTFYQNVDRGAHVRIPFRFLFTSDIAYSSQDGLYDGDGWSIDNITVKRGNVVRFADNCESGPGLWDVSIFPPVGDLFAISSNVFTEDVCTENRTNVWSDWDPSTQSVVPRLDNLLRTPAVFTNRPSQAFVVFDVYRNLPLQACFYYHLRFRTRNAEDPVWSEWVDPTRLIYYGSSKDWARQKVALPGASGKDSIQVEFGLTDYAQIYCGGIGNANGVYTFFDNVAVGVVSTAPPQFIQRDIDLFQDTFRTTPFFNDDNFNSPLGDSAVVEVSTASGYQSGFMKWRLNGGSWNSTSLLPAATALPRLRYADVPPGSYPANTTLEYYFEVTDNMNATGTLPAGASPTEGPYFSASILPVKSATNPSLGCFDSLATVLVVNNYVGREPENLWAEALRGQGYKFDVWDVNGPTSGIGNTPGGSAPSSFYHWPSDGVDPLLQYSTILWHAGSLTTFTLSKEDQALLQGWIQQPGKNRNLWIAGDNVAYDLFNGREFNAFLGFTCGMRYLRDSWENFPQDTLHPVVTGTAGAAAGGRQFHVDGDCPIIDKLDLIATSTQGAGSGKVGLLLKYPNTFGAATRYATKYVSFGSDSSRVVFQGFNFSNIEEGGERLMYAKNVMLDYFQVPACYTPTAVTPDPAPQSPSFQNALAQNAPNPFNPSTTIRYSVARTGPVTIRIFNAGGALVRTLVDAPHAPGEYSVRWDGKDGAGGRLSSGVYFYRIETGSGFKDAKKLLLMK